MWFAKWFGGRSDRDDDEPARFAPAAPRPVSSAQRAQGNVGGAKATAGPQQDKSGFDPYNSGSYDRNQAWEKVLR
jgi:hypothetical protein